jgi:CheY-like chemotaxis protein
MSTLSPNLAREVLQDRGAANRLPSILVVDDSVDSANSLCLLLGKYGYTTHVAYRWVEALEVAKDHLPDLVLLDLGMPELDGVHLARFFREDEQLKEIMLVAVTGYADDLHQQQCKAAGFDSFLSKPVAWSDLQATLEKVSRNRRP